MDHIAFELKVWGLLDFYTAVTSDSNRMLFEMMCLVNCL